MNIAVYCASSMGKDPIFASEAKKLGKWLAENHHTLVYGAASVGIMSVVANAALANGGKVIGVIPKFLDKIEITHKGLSELIKVSTMAERKTRMMELADCFVALPGGPGTLEEISEIISLVRVDELKKPYFICNIAGFYNNLRQFFIDMLNEGFITEAEYQQIKFVSNIDELTNEINKYNNI